MLPFPLQPGALETPSDYASRLSVRAWRNSLHEFCLDFDIDATLLVNGDPTCVRRLADLTGQDPEAFMSASFMRFSDRRRYRHRGEVLVQHCLSRDRVRACPVCVAEDLETGDMRVEARPYRRSIWIVEAVRTCPVHDIELIDLGTGTTALRTHDIQHVLSGAIPDLPRHAQLAVRRSLTAFEHYALRRLGAEQASPAPTASWLDALELHAALRLCQVVGAVKRTGPRVVLDELNNADRRDAEAEGFEVLRRGESGVREFLDGLQSAFHAKRHDWGPREMYGRLYEWLAHENDDEAYEPMRDVIWRHVVETLPVGPGDVLFGKEIPVRRVHSIRSASCEFALHPKRTRKVLQQEGIIGPESAPLADERVTFGAERGGQFLTELAGSMSLVQLGKYIGAPRPHDRLLVEAGFLKPWIPGGTEVLKNHAFRKADADAFLAALLADAQPNQEGWPDLFDIPSAAKRACAKAEQIVELLLGRKLTRVGRNENAKGYLSVLVDPQEVRAFVTGEDHGGVTLRQMEKELRTTTRVVTGLIENGLIVAERVPNPVNKCPQTIVRPGELERFRSSYVSLQELARERGEHFRHTMKYLSTLAVRPVLDPASLGVSLYRRSDLP